MEFPEALLSSNEHNIKVFMRDDAGPAWVLSKKHFASVVWDDPLVSRQLVDNYNGSLPLSRLELVTIALKCSGARKTYGDSLPWRYVLRAHGLDAAPSVSDPRTANSRPLRRLSLANDSDMLIDD